MSTTVDNRVVQMKFSNEQFERGIKTSLGSLERLKQSLNFDGAMRSLSRSFSGIEQAISLGGVARSIDTISDRFSAMGIVGATVLSNLTTQAMNLAAKLGNIVFNPIIEGGKTRARNIEQAKFQIEGLNVAWEDIEDDINYGVKDTAYGLDAAAKVASQLLASQVKVGDSMKTALRGVSGVAAMTSSSYEDIGQVFTAVAGQGRVMAMQLNQLSLRGINAAATLANYLHVTEAEVRDMTSKGQIDFATFAAAMDDAYGAHAKDANKTFTGAMSNTRAALARIGAKFATPAYNNLRDVLNALIPVINNVNKALDPMVTFAEKNMEAAAKTVAAILGNVEKMNFDNGALKNIAETVGFLSSQGVKVFRAVKNGFKDVFSPVTAQDAERITKTVKELSEKFKMTDGNAKRLRRTVKNIFTVFKTFGAVVSGVISVLTPAMNKASDIVDKLFRKIDGIAEKSAGFFSGFDKGVVISNLQKAIKLFKDDLSSLKPRVQNLFNNLKTAVEPIVTAFGKAGGAVKEFFTKGMTAEQERRLNLFGETFAVIADSVISVGKAMAKAAAPIIAAITEMFPKVGMNRVLLFFEGVSDFAKKLVVRGKTAENIKNTVKGLLSVFDIAAQMLSAVVRVIFPTTDGLFSLRDGIVIMSAGIVIMSAALRVLAGALTVVGKIENAVYALNVFSSALLLFGMEGALLGKFAPLILAGSVVINALAASITVLAGALMVMSNVKNGLEGLILMTSTLAIFSGAAVLFANYLHLIGPFASSMVVMSFATLVMSSALTVLAGALRLLSGTDIEVLFVLISAMGILSITASLFGETIPVLFPFAAGIAAVGAAMILLAAGVGAMSFAITMLYTTLPILVYSIGNTAVALVESVISIGMALLVGLEALVPELVNAAFKIVMTLVRALVLNVPAIVKGGMALILGILKGIESHIGDILIVTGMILVKFIEGLTAILPPLITAGAALVVSFINGVADALRDNAEPLFGALGNLLSSLIEFAISAIQQLVAGIPTVGSKISDALEEAKTEIREKLAPDSMNDVGSNAANAAVDGVSSADKNAESAGAGLGEMFTKGLGSMMPSMESLGAGLGENFTGSLGGSLPDMSSIGSGLGTDFSTGLGSTDRLTSDAAGSLGDSVFDGLDLDLSSLGLDSGTTYALGMSDSETEVDKSSEQLTSSAEQTLKSPDGDFKRAGFSNAANYARGIVSARGSAANAAKQTAQNGVLALNSKYDDYRRAGYNSGIGFSVGLGSDSRGAVHNAARELAQTALDAMTDTLDIHSPSRKFERFGEHSDKGYARGVLNNTDIVYEAVQKLGETATNAMSAAIIHVSDVMLGGTDSTPTIRPVVDLDDVISGVSAINGMFAGSSVNVGTIRGDISYRNAGLLSAIASEMSSMDSGTVQTVTAINDLRSEVAQLGARISRMQVRMDSGALVGQLADPLDAEFGRRAVMKGRGV